MLRGVAEALAQFDRERHVDVDRQRVVGRSRLRLGHAPRDRLLEARELGDLDSALGTTAGTTPLPVTCRLDISLRDAAARARALNGLKLNAGFLGKPPRNRRSLDPLTAAVRILAV